MKKSNQNSLVRDFIGAAFCLTMAFALLMMFSGCSEENSPMNGAHGGAAEEQGVYALAGQSGNVVPMMLGFAGEKVSKVMSLSAYGGSIYAQKGAVVTVYELDSLTLEKTDRSIVGVVSNDEGRFTFDSISFNSPYVMIEVLDSCKTENCANRNGINSSLFLWSDVKIPYRLSAIVDLRSSKEVSVNLLTNAKIPFLRARYAEGLSFAQANEAAERDFLESFGIYENMDSFEKLTDENSELAYVVALMLAVKISENVYDPMEFYSLNSWFGGFPQKAILAQGQKFWQYYLNMQKMIDYYIGYLVKKNDLPRCMNAQEGTVEVVKIRNSTLSIMCRSGKWTPGFKMLEHTNGTMTDNRDGKTYKTVTYNFGGVAQTWMAENLNFADTTSPSADSTLKKNLLGRTFCIGEDSFCDINGREYIWMSAMNIGMDDIRLLSVDTLGVKKVVDDTCKQVFLWPIEENNSEYEFADKVRRDSVLRDSVMSVCLEKYFVTSFDYSKFISAERPVVHQGVCPEGWRVPNKNDWDILLKNISAYYGVGVMYAGDYLIDDYATGFGLKRVFRFNKGEINMEGGGILISDFGINFAMVPDVDDVVDVVDLETFENPKYVVEFDFGVISGIGISKNVVDHFVGVDAPGVTNWSTYVRCIKN